MGRLVQTWHLLLIAFNLTAAVCTQINQIVGYNPPSYAPPSNGIYVSYGFGGTYTNGRGQSKFWSWLFSHGCYYDNAYGGQYSYISCSSRSLILTTRNTNFPHRASIVDFPIRRGEEADAVRDAREEEQASLGRFDVMGLMRLLPLSSLMPHHVTCNCV